ncbi:hypothetical protein GcM1_166005, partial [Golovinomyces cichoracearum]
RSSINIKNPLDCDDAADLTASEGLRQPDSLDQPFPVKAQHGCTCESGNGGNNFPNVTA